MLIVSSKKCIEVRVSTQSEFLPRSDKDKCWNKGLFSRSGFCFCFCFFSVIQRSNHDTSLEMGLLECSELFSLPQGLQACWFYSYYGCDLVDCQGHHGAAELENNVANVKIPGTSVWWPKSSSLPCSLLSGLFCPHVFIGWLWESLLSLTAWFSECFHCFSGNASLLTKI